MLNNKILIVDDDETALVGLKELLERAGYDVVAASTFEKGRLALTSEAPDLLITDIRLGAYNGLQLLATNTRPIPSIILTGFPDPVLEADARRFGAEYLLKPLSPPHFLKIVKQKLTKTETPPVFTNSRRWARKPVRAELHARINNESARVLDVSYGGLRLEVDRQSQPALPSSFVVSVPSSAVSVPVDLVWSSRHHGETWLCGVAVAVSDELAHAWYGLVDALA